MSSRRRSRDARSHRREAESAADLQRHDFESELWERLDRRIAELRQLAYKVALENSASQPIGSSDDSDAVTANEACDDAILTAFLCLRRCPAQIPTARLIELINQYMHGDWTDEKNQRRSDLIDREVAGTLTPSEKQELAMLQQAMLRHRDQLAPVPLDEARKLRDKLLKGRRRKDAQGR